MGISATYASPGLRHGLLLEDHPQAVVTFTCQKGTELGIPRSAGGDEEYAVATITFPASSNKSTAVGWKALKSGEKRKGDHDSDVWQVLCTKALGRALKRAGYPADTTDLKALLLWRQRGVEIQSLAGGTTTVKLTQAAIEEALSSSGRASEDELDLDDGDAPVEREDGGSDDDIAEAEVVEEHPTAAQPAKPRQRALPAGGTDDAGRAPDEETVKELRATLGSLGTQQKKVTAWGRQNGIKVSNPASQADALAALTYAQAVAAGEDPDAAPAAAEGDAPPVEVDEATVTRIAGLVESLTNAEKASFAAFLGQQGLDPDFDPATINAGQADDIIAWFTVTGD